jgi:hypothetical protein
MEHSPRLFWRETNKEIIPSMTTALRVSASKMGAIWNKLALIFSSKTFLTLSSKTSGLMWLRGLSLQRAYLVAVSLNS